MNFFEKFVCVMLSLFWIDHLYAIHWRRKHDKQNRKELNEEWERAKSESARWTDLTTKIIYDHIERITEIENKLKPKKERTRK